MTTDSDEGALLPPIPMNITDIALSAINRKLNTVQRTAPSAPNAPSNPQGQNNPFAASPIPQPCGAPQKAGMCENPICEQVRFFKDSAGNEYRMKDGKLYIKGWADTNLKFRLLNSTTNKELSMENKKIQIYGWHKVETVVEEEKAEVESEKVDEIEEVIEEAKNEE